MKLRDMLTALIILELIMLAFWLGTRDAEAQGQFQIEFVPLISFQGGGIRPQGDMEPRDWPFGLDWTVIDPAGGIREPVRQSPDGGRNDDEEDDAGDGGRAVGDGAGGAGGG